MRNIQVSPPKLCLHRAYYYSALATLFFFHFAGAINAQRPSYDIKVRLDTMTHELSGVMQINYTNHSAASLDSLAIHLWTNAYADKNSVFAKQLLNLGNLIFRDARQDEMGGYETINFSSPQDSISFHYAPEGKDIGWIVLSKPLESDQTIKINISFIEKIPISFSRIGRTGDSYQLTQWYPHIAVYDQEGWHTMHYFDQGEYFNDFADYNVSITVPSGYSIASTGMRTDKQVEENQSTWKFSAENVIDFAWFANPHFRLIEKEMQVENSQTILLSIYVDTLSAVSWDSAMIYAERALNFYSDWLGPYPYPHMSVVAAPWSKGGYMEYPMVAQIGTTSGEDFLDIVIAHEIGHAWLYSILANDERSNPWMDEGLNTFFERKYAQLYYPGYKELVFNELFRTPMSMPDNDALQHTMIYTHQLRPSASDPQFQSANQYLFSAYLLPAEGLEMMQSKLGPTKMKAMFRQYYQDRNFTHVAPVDLRVSFESNCECDLSWFFDDWIHKASRLDYRIKKFKPKVKEVTLINKGDFDLPVHITSFMKGVQIADYWIDGFRGEKIYHLDKRADKVLLFKDVPVANKVWWGNSTSNSFLPHISIIPKVGSYDRSMWSITPFIGHNLGDGILLGPVIISDLFPQKHFKWTVAPLYGLGSKEIRGYAEGRYSADFSKGIFDKMLISFSVNKFGYNLDTHYLYRDSYRRLSPTIALRIAYNDEHAHLTQWWKYRYVDIHQDYGEGINYPEKTYKTNNYGVHELSYTILSDYVLRPYIAFINAQTGQGFAKFNFYYQQHFTGRDKMRGVWMHAFAGYQMLKDQTKLDTRFTLSGIPSLDYHTSDYMFDQWLGGRNATSGLYAQQIFLKDAGFKTLADIDRSSKWMTAAGISYAMPLKMFHLYMDAAFYGSDLTQKERFSYSGGIALILVKDVFEVYFPVLESKDIRNSITYEEKDTWYQHITFQANIRLLNPMDVMDRVTLHY